MVSAPIRIHSMTTVPMEVMSNAAFSAETADLIIRPRDFEGHAEGDDIQGVLKCHKIVMIQHSTVFRHMLEGGNHVDNIDDLATVDLPETHETLHRILHLAYDGNAEAQAWIRLPMAAHELPEVYTAANKYDMQVIVSLLDQVILLSVQIHSYWIRTDN